MRTLCGTILAAAISVCCSGALSAETGSADGYTFVDPMIGTEGTGTEYGGMMPMAGVPFGSMNLVPVTRTNGVSRTSFNALDGELLGFILTRQP